MRLTILCFLILASSPLALSAVLEGPKRSFTSDFQMKPGVKLPNNPVEQGMIEKECLEGVLGALGDPNLTVLPGGQIVRSSPNVKTTIYSQNGRTTEINDRGNCRELGSDSNESFKSIVERGYPLLKASANKPYYIGNLKCRPGGDLKDCEQMEGNSGSPMRDRDGRLLNEEDRRSAASHRAFAACKKSKISILQDLSKDPFSTIAPSTPEIGR